MDQRNEELFTALGIDIPTAMERFMDDEALLLRFLAKLPANDQFGVLQEMLDTRQPKEALIASHNLKSLTGNLSLMELHRLFSDQVSLFRADDWDGAVAMMPVIMKEYERILDVLKEYDIHE